MKKIVQFLILIALLNSCTSTKNYSNRRDEDKALQDVVQKLNKNPNNESAGKALPILYADIQQSHLSNIKSFKAANKESSPRWNDIIIEYQALQNAYNTIINSNAAFKIVQPADYAINTTEIKEAAAHDFYQQALSILESQGRSSAKKAYTYFKICEYYVPGYKEVISKINIAYGRAVINIVIDSLQDNSFFLNSVWSKPGYNLSNELFQERLTADLQNDSFNSEYPIEFLTENEAQKNNVRADWAIHLNVTNMHISAPGTSSFNLPSQSSYAGNTVNYIVPNFSADTGSIHYPAAYAPSDVVSYTTTSAPINYIRYNRSAKAILLLNIKDSKTLKDISVKTFTVKCSLRQSTELTSTQYISSYNSSEQELYTIMQHLYNKIYPQIKDIISAALK